MDYKSFIKSTSNKTPPNLDSELLVAMWNALKGNWDTAHEIVQEIDSLEAAWIHAYLHRVEGDLSNAKYWYRRAKHDTIDLSLEEEAEMIIRDIVKE